MIKHGIDVHTVPMKHLKPIMARVNPLMKHWGRFCDSLTLEQLCLSCYSQGIIDGMQIAKNSSEQPTDYQI